MLQILHDVHHEFYVQYYAVLSGVVTTVVQHGMPALLVAVMKRGLIERKIRDMQRLVTGSYSFVHDFNLFIICWFSVLCNVCTVIVFALI
jgi:hypothetical protein